MDNKRPYQICTRCIMDTTASEITFDTNGVCNFCTEFVELAKTTIWRPLEVRTRELDSAVKRIKELGKGQKYDCLIGLSGGVDSSFLCLWAKEKGLKPLVIHFDNGWNSELAVMNIQNIIQKTGFDLHTYVINWEEFKDLQLSYLKAGVIDLEVPTDQLIFAAIYKIARKFGIRSVINGHNTASEAILPKSWIMQDKFDWVNLKDIHDRYGMVKLKDFPKFDLITQLTNNTLYKMYSVWPLDLMDYNKDEAKKRLIKEFGWRDYGGKHYESVFTRFYQGYILPKRFNVDKRRAHLSNLIIAGGYNREAALKEMKEPPYEEKLQKEDLEYVAKKFEISKSEFDKYMKLPIKLHSEYATQWDKKHYRKYLIFKKTILPILKFIAKFKK